MCSKNQLNMLTKDIVQEYRKVYGEAIESILLFGSYARGEENEDSDIDIVAIVHGERLILQKQLKQVWNASAELSLENDVIISPAVIPFDEYEKYKDTLPYYNNISKDGLVIG